MRYETIGYITHHLISPDPLLRALPYLVASYGPPPAGSGDERAIDWLAVGDTPVDVMSETTRQDGGKNELTKTAQSVGNMSLDE